MKGAEYLIQAYTTLKKKYPELLVNIVGMQEKDFVKLPDGVNCYGYLDKAQKKDRDLYYSLLENSKVFVNTTPKWAEVLKDSLKIKKRIKYGILSLIKTKILSL
jgi:glycosyltransferase involved in cell wall biosynthesis